MFAYKQYIETGYRLLVTVNAHSEDRSDQRLDETLSAVRALLSAEGKARLTAEPSSDMWDDLIQQKARPLAALKTALAPVGGTGVLHLVLGINCLVWVLYGFGRDGRFHGYWGASDQAVIAHIRDVYRLMYEQLEADRIDDSLVVESLGDRIEHLGGEIGLSMPAAVVAALDEFDHLLYVPHPEGNLDEFPVTVIRTSGRWLTERLTITRTTTFTMLQGLLSPNLPTIRPNPIAMVVLGSAETGGARPRGTRRHANVVQGLLASLGFTSSTAESAGLSDVNSWLDGGCGVFHYAGHGIAESILEALPLPTGESFDPIYAENYLGYRLPFVFLCACVAARIRYGAGGHLIGLMTGLIDRGAPAGLAFSTPVAERHAYLIAEHFYRHARHLPFSAAVARTLSTVRSQVPSYAWLAVTAYGDPKFRLPAMADSTAQAVPALRDQTPTWHSAVRSHCALRTAHTADAVRTRLQDVPQELQSHIEHWLSYAFSPQPNPRAVKRLERAAARATRLPAVERLTAKAAACVVRLTAFGADSFTIRKAPGFGPLTQIPADNSFVARLGAALIDDQLNGLGLGLMGIFYTAFDLAEHAPEPLRQAIAQLWVYEDTSPFVADLVDACRHALSAIDSLQ
jgi:hypothetical protein